MSVQPEAYLLLTIPNASIDTPSGRIAGDLALEYVTFDAPTAGPDVLLVVRVGTFETVLDPTRTVAFSVLPSGEHSYTLHGTADAAELALTLPAPSAHAQGADDIETFHSVLAEYGDFRGPSTVPPYREGDGKALLEDAKPVPEEDLRGRFVLVNEDNGEIIGALDNNVRVREDPLLGEKGHEKDPVVVELPEGADDLNDVEVMVRSIPPEDRGWMMKGAVLASHVISGTTTLLTGAMTTASGYYIAHSTPSPHANPSSPESSTKGNPTVSVPPPSRTLLLLQSPTTRKNLTRVHAVSGHAVKLSSKTLGVIDGVIDHFVGNDKSKGKGKEKAAVPAPPPRLASGSTLRLPDGDKPPLPPRSRPSSPVPPPYSPGPPALSVSSEKPPLPPRKTPVPSPVPSRAPSPEGPPKPLRTRARIALSAALVLGAMSAATTRLVDVGGEALSSAVAHKYGQEAGNNVRMATGTARNVTLVYVDVRGMGRRAIVKKAAKGWMKSSMMKK
ncbi:hypothetical protein OF83DRAFT_1239174 [Amylostereum chailletii]|nr:hypothetical protein OF83DRAFT_1239174 [Amylostereum chailletii]